MPTFQNLSSAVGRASRSQVLRYGSGLTAAFVLGMAVMNAHVTADALKGDQSYFIHKYCPKIAARAAAGAVKKEQAREQRDWPF